MNLPDYINNSEIKLFDGGMGTQLAVRGVEMGGGANLTHPDTVREVHEAYVTAGSRLIITNTLTMNPIHIRTHGLDIDVEQINLKGAKLAGRAAGKDHFVLGDIGPTGKLIEPYGPLSEKEAAAGYREQARHLANGGVHGFIVETMLDMNEAVIAVKMCKQETGLPVIATMAFATVKSGGRTIMGHTAKDCAVTLSEAGADAVGANCGDVDPAEMAGIIASFCDAVDLPVVAQPNAGKPVLINGKTQFDMPPDTFAKGVQQCIDAGAKLVGGCCGTTPDHIRAVFEKIG